MSDTIIRVENLGKKYIIGHQSQGHSNYGTLRDVIADGAKSLVKSFSGGKSSLKANQEEFWALKDVSFEVQRGECIGIIGRNGAGKSTLLKILSRITEPTTGKIEIDGRVASLLEVGTGFHPELTGRENIYLNGAILGMSREEIQRKFDEIVAFAEIEKFLDTPVKRYSSGMYVRLAFAVAAHLEPEILIVDEVLAVGDAAFQKKCLGKMGDVATKEGRTVLFVSHNMATIQNLCNQVIVMNKGIKKFEGQTDQGINYYLQTCLGESNQDIINRKDREGKGNIKINQVNIEDNNGYQNISFPIGSELCLKIQYTAQKEIRNPHIIIGVYDSSNIGMARFDTNIVGGLPSSIPRRGELSCLIEPINLVPGKYYLNIAFLSNGEMEDYIPFAKSLEIAETDYFGTGKLVESKLSKVLFKHQWKLDYIDNFE